MFLYLYYFVLISALCLLQTSFSLIDLAAEIYKRFYNKETIAALNYEIRYDRQSITIKAFLYNVHGQIKIKIDRHSYHGQTRIYMNRYDCTWIDIDEHGQTKIDMGRQGYTCRDMNIHIETWIDMVTCNA